MHWLYEITADGIAIAMCGKGRVRRYPAHDGLFVPLGHAEGISTRSYMPSLQENL